MVDETCPICKARCESIMHEYDEQMMILREDYAERMACLHQKHEESVMLQAERKTIRFEIIELTHAEHVGDNDA